jgi:hypothetical protein
VVTSTSPRRKRVSPAGAGRARVASAGAGGLAGGGLDTAAFDGGFGATAFGGGAAVWPLQPLGPAFSAAVAADPTVSRPAGKVHWPSCLRQCPRPSQTRRRLQSDRTLRSPRNRCPFGDPILRRGLVCIETSPDICMETPPDSHSFEPAPAPRGRRPRGRRKPRSLFQRLRTASWRILPSSGFSLFFLSGRSLDGPRST